MQSFWLELNNLDYTIIFHFNSSLNTKQCNKFLYDSAVDVKLKSVWKQFGYHCCSMVNWYVNVLHYFGRFIPKHRTHFTFEPSVTITLDQLLVKLWIFPLPANLITYKFPGFPITRKSNNIQISRFSHYPQI